MCRGPLTLDSPEMIAQASRAGLGLAYVWEWMVADDIASGRLVEVLVEWTPLVSSDIALDYPGRRHHGRELARLRSVILAQETTFGIRAKAASMGCWTSRSEFDQGIAKFSRHPAEPVAEPSRNGRYLCIPAMPVDPRRASPTAGRTAMRPRASPVNCWREISIFSSTSATMTMRFSRCATTTYMPAACARLTYEPTFKTDAIDRRRCAVEHNSTARTSGSPTRSGCDNPYFDLTGESANVLTTRWADDLVLWRAD